MAPREYAGGAERHTVLGPDDGARDCELRYFLIPAGGATVLERHPHEHAILVLHGHAEVRLGDDRTEVAPGDAVLVHRDELRQLTPLGDEDLGFLCTARVDRPPRPAGT